MRRPRFSLLSMVLFTLLCGSAVALWMHWPNWRPISAIPNVYSCTDSKKSGDMATLDPNGVVTLRTATGAIKRVLPGEIRNFDSDVQLAFSESDQFLVVRWSDTTIENSIQSRMWNLVSNEWEQRFSIEANDVIHFGGERDDILLVSRGSRTRVLSTKSGTLLLEANGKLLGVYSDGKTVCIRTARDIEHWDVLTGTRLSTTPFEGMVAGIKTQVDLFASIPRADILEVRNIRTGDLLLSVPLDGSKFNAISGGWAKGNYPRATFSDDGKELMVTGFFPGIGYAAQLWNLSERKKSLDLAGSEDWVRGAGHEADYPLFRPPLLMSARMKQTSVAIWDKQSGSFLGNRSCVDWCEPYGIDMFGSIFLLSDPKRDIDRVDYMQVVFTAKDRMYARESGTNRNLYILAPHRPEAWWGVAWLPEFWSTVVFAGLFVWNLWRWRFSR